jgi:hypothetical protein
MCGGKEFVTETEWLGCEDPEQLLRFLHHDSSERKLRLFCAGYCRRIWNLLTDERSRKAVEVAERYADGSANAAELDTALEAAKRAIPHVGHSPSGPEEQAAAAAAEAAAATDPEAAARSVWGWARNVKLAQCFRETTSSPFPEDAKRVRDVAFSESAMEGVALLRDLFNNPFRPITIDPNWRTPKVLAFSQDIYEKRAFIRMHELADALERAGCASPDILIHCREPGEHVRGCWLLDLLLGKR